MSTRPRAATTATPPIVPASLRVATTVLTRCLCSATRFSATVRSTWSPSTSARSPRGKRYGVDEVFYSYHDGKVKLRQHQLTSSGEHLWAHRTVSHCVYDMLNIFLRARSFNPEGWKSGHEIDFPIADGKNISPARLRYSGKVKIKADNGVKYRCLKLSYLEKEDGKYKRIVDFYVSDDKNHIPVRLDMFLKFGAAKAFLVSMKGLRNPVTSAVR